MAILGEGDQIVLGSCRLTFHMAKERALESTSPVVLADRGTIAVEVDGYVIAKEVPPTAEMLESLHKAMRRICRAQNTERLQELLAEEFRRALLPEKIAIGIEKDNTCTWPYVYDGDGKKTDVGDLADRLKPRLEEFQGSQVLDWLTIRSGTQPFPTDLRKRLVLLFPVKSATRRIGHIYVEFPHAGQSPPAESVEMLALLARDAALLWENLGLREWHKGLQEELRRTGRV